MMIKQELAELLETKVNSYSEIRAKFATHILDNPKLFEPLLKLSFDTDNKISIRASWVLEFVLREKLDWILPHLDYFTDNISRLHFDSAVRAISKICEFLAKSYTSKTTTNIKKNLKKTHIKKIIETGFDWLISNHKVAVKAYTMETLYLFGKKHKWVHDELKLVLQQEISSGSPAYKARAKKILKWLR